MPARASWPETISSSRRSWDLSLTMMEQAENQAGDQEQRRYDL
jgi:hypothetical protein